MKIEINTVYNKGFKWYAKENIQFKGFLKYKGTYFERVDAIDFLLQYQVFDQLKLLLPDLDGMFSFIVSGRESVIIAVDRMRTFPLFYSQSVNGVYITDDPYQLIENGLNNKRAKEFLLLGFTSGAGTLLQNVYQTEAAEVLLLESSTKKKNTYYTHRVTDTVPVSIHDRSEKLEDLLFDSFKHFIGSLGGGPVALSLSGGYDSRLICYMLNHFGYSNVTCFTYGRKGNEELQISRKVAEKMGFPWTFIEYNHKLSGDYLNSDEFNSYVRFSGRLSSMPYLQDYFAIRYLQDQKLVPDNTIFISGHSGDSIAGSHLKGIFRKNDGIGKVINAIYQNHYKLSRVKGKNKFYDLIETQLGSFDKTLSYSVYEDWILKERQAKFVINSASVYDFFGYEYRMPLWDKDLVTFFKSLPLEYKNFKYLYHKVLEKLFEKNEILFESELQATERDIFKQKIKDRIKSFLPPKVVRKLQKPGWDAYDILTAPMAEELKKTNFETQCGIEYNSVICNWYLKRVEELVDCIGTQRN